MECLIGIKGKDFVMMAADTVAARSIFAMKHDNDKMLKLGDNLLMTICGDSGDASQFSEYIAKNIALYRMRNGYSLSPSAAANFTRRTLAEALRSRGAYQVNMLLGGCDKDSGPELFFMDYLSSMVSLPFAAHGYGSFFSLSVMDRYYKEDLNEAEATELLRKCIDEIHTRFVVNQTSYKVRVVTKDGIKDLPEMTPKNLRTA